MQISDYIPFNKVKIFWEGHKIWKMKISDLYKGTKILSLEIDIFELKMMVKSGLECFWHKKQSCVGTKSKYVKGCYHLVAFLENLRHHNFVLRISDL